MAEKKVNVRHHYDKESDVLYVHFGETEPTHVENIDDFLLLEIGWFSGLPRGFRIIGPKYHKVSAFKVTMVVKQIKDQVRELMEERRRAIKEQEPVFTNFCDTLPNILETAQL
jgi:uncharacterized protein YuzE